MVRVLICVLILGWDNLNCETSWKNCCPKMQNTLRYLTSLLLKLTATNSSGSSFSFPSAVPVSLAMLKQSSSDSLQRLHYNLDKTPLTGWWKGTDCWISATVLQRKVATNQPKPGPILVNSTWLQTMVNNTSTKQWVGATNQFLWPRITESKNHRCSLPSTCTQFPYILQLRN